MTDISDTSDPADPADPAEPAEPVAADPAPARKPTADRRSSGGRTGDGLSSLVGSGGSQVGTNGAMRARDVSRPR